MAGLYDGLEQAPDLLTPAPSLPAVPKSLYDGLELAPAPEAQGHPSLF